MSSPSASEWSQQLAAQSASAQEILHYYQQQIAIKEPVIQGFTEVFEAPVQSQQSIYSIPLALKDNICLEGYRTTCGSKMLQNFVAPYQATVSQKLLAAGVPIMGKTNMDEFAMGSSTENSALKQTRNPWQIDCVPGGSSGGSAAVVAADEVPWSLGSDTGGSIRLPAAFCGLVGMKPTYGRVSRYGLVAYASSLDQIGPMTRTVADNALLLNLIAGPDPQDSTCLPEAAPDFSALLGQEIKGLRLGVPEEMLSQGIDPEVRQAFETALKQYEALGAEIVPVRLPTVPYSLAAYYLIATSEASSNLARYDGVSYGHRAAKARNLTEMYVNSRSEGFGMEVKRRIMLGTFALSSGYYDAYYLKALKVRTLLIQEFQQAFEQADVLISPTSPCCAFPFGARSEDPLQMYLTDILTVSANLTGMPALSLPCGFNSQGLPIGLQLMGKALDEARLYQVAEAYEQACRWHVQRPVVAGQTA